jgi:hypothetical protein
MVETEVVRTVPMTPENVRARNLLPSPESPLDISQIQLVPQTGRARQGKDLEEKFKIKYVDYDGEVVTVSAWDLLTFITADVRLSNITKVDRRYVEWCLKCAKNNLQMGCMEAFADSVFDMMTIVEPSLGLGGYLRQMLQTIKQESQHVQIEQTDKKTNIFGFAKKTTSG